MQQTRKISSLLFVFVASLWLVSAACAAEDECSGQGGAACASEGQESPPLRESLDKAREDLAGKLFGLQLSAFGDVQSIYDDAGRQKLDWGVFEIDASVDFSDNLQGAMAVVKDQVDTTMPVRFLDYHTSGGSIAPRGRLWVEKGLHIQAGRFDVPFGNDWQFFASKDSVSISRPLTTDIVMDGGYNDTGFRVLGNNGSVNFNAFLMHGFSAGRLVGGRVGLTPFSDPFSLKGAQEPKSVEIGLSYFYDALSGWKKNEVGWAVDGEAHLDDWSGRFEYMFRKKDFALSESTVLRGWHFTQEYALGETVAWPTTLFARYERAIVRPAEIATLGTAAGDDRDVRVAAGVSSIFGKIVHLKFEMQHYNAATPSTREMPGFGRRIFWFTQMVVLL